MAQVLNRGKGRWMVRVFLGRGDDHRFDFRSHDGGLRFNGNLDERVDLGGLSRRDFGFGFGLIPIRGERGEGQFFTFGTATERIAEGRSVDIG